MARWTEVPRNEDDKEFAAAKSFKAAVNAAAEVDGRTGDGGGGGAAASLATKLQSLLPVHDRGPAARKVIYATGHGGSSVAGDIVGAYAGGLSPSAIQAISAT